MNFCSLLKSNVLQGCFSINPPGRARCFGLQTLISVCFLIRLGTRLPSVESPFLGFFAQYHPAETDQSDPFGIRKPSSLTGTITTPNFGAVSILA